MPRISEFFGIAIFMYWFDQQKHQAPHFHARTAGEDAGKEIPWVAPLR